MKVHPKYVQPVVMAAIIAFLMTAFVTWLNIGLPSDFIARWMHAFALAWPLASVSAFLAGMVAPQITQRIVRAINGRDA